MPLPVPLEPLVRLIQKSLLIADQLHEDCVVTDTLPVPPTVGRLCDVGDAVNEHVPACVTVTV